eukprot:837322-Prymnesium_polylepis.1
MAERPQSLPPLPTLATEPSRATCSPSRSLFCGARARTLYFCDSSKASTYFQPSLVSHALQ